MKLAYHVLHEGRRVGPYDRRTIVGLRIKKTLSSEHQLEASDGSRLTVAELIGRPAPASEFNSLRSGAYTSARHTCSACLIEGEPGPVEIPAFRGEVEVRVHSDVLRIAGKHRSGMGMKDGRVKLPLNDIALYRRTGSRVDLWLRESGVSTVFTALQRLSLDLFTAAAAQDLLQWLPDVKPWPEALVAAKPPAPAKSGSNAALSPLLWASVIGMALVAGFVLWVALRRRF